MALVDEKGFNFPNPNKEKLDVFTIRLNPQERALVNEAKRLFDVKADGKALKMLAIVGLNVLQQTLSPKVLRYVCAENRERLSQYKSLINEF